MPFDVEERGDERGLKFDFFACKARAWPHVEQCDRGRSQRARHRGTEWRPTVSMQVRRVRDRLGL